MIVTEIDIPLKLPDSDTPRGTGVHQSAIIRNMAVEGGHLNPQWVEELTLDDKLVIKDPRHILRICLGLAWEKWYIQWLAQMGVVDHPGEICLDGVHMNPDGESVDVILTEENQERHELIVHEVKLTYKSMRTCTPENQWMWIRQIMGYCKGKGTLFGMLHVVFVCGDYSYPITPDKKIWLLKFTKEEINASWQQQIQYRDDYLRKEREKNLGNNT